MGKVFGDLLANLKSAGIVADFINEPPDDSEIKQLRMYATQDEAIIRFTRDPQRFSTEHVDKWLAKKRDVFKLIDPDGQLLAIVWLGKSQLPPSFIEAEKYPHTLSVRTYGSARGKGIAGSLIESAIDQYLAKHDSQVGIWSETSVDNSPVHRILTKLGFVKLADPEREATTGKVIFAREY